MGGYAVWQMAIPWNAFFAVVVPICGGGMYWNAWRLSQMGVWAFHGSEDKTVLPEESKKMVNAINSAGGNAKLSIYEGVAHNVWLNAYRSEELFERLLAQRLNNPPTNTDDYTDAVTFG